MKTVFKRLITSLLLVVMLISSIPASLVSAASDDIDWERLKEKYGLTDSQVEAAKEIADEYNMTPEQIGAAEDYYDSLTPEEQNQLKEDVKNGEISSSEDLPGETSKEFMAAMLVATLKSAAKDILGTVLEAMEGVSVPNPFDIDRLYDETGKLTGVNFVLEAPDNVDVVDAINSIVERYAVLDSLKMMAGAVVLFDEVTVNGYTVYDLADPSDVRNALVNIYRANPIEFSTIANMEGNVLATYHFSLNCRGVEIDLPVSFVIECSEARLSKLKATAQMLADLVEVNGDFTENDGIFSADLEGTLDVSDYTDNVLQLILPSQIATEYAFVRDELLHVMTVNDLIDQIKLEDLRVAAEKLGYEAQFNTLVNKIATYFKLATAKYDDLKELVSVIDENGLFSAYVKALAQKAYGVFNAEEKLNKTVGSFYNGDGSYSFVVGNGFGPKGIDSYVDAALDRLLNTKIEDRISNALKAHGYASVEAYVEAAKDRYNKIYTGKYDLDVTFTLVLFDVYTVTFVDANGKVIDTQKVVAGDSAEDPYFHGGASLNTNYTADVVYEKVMSDLTVTLTPENHKMVSEVVDEGSCTEPRVEHFKCEYFDDCGYEYTDFGEYGHNYDDGVVTKEPTCMEKGEKTYTCLDCGDTYVEYIPVVDCLFTVIEEKDPGCEEDGYVIIRCKYGCGREYTINLPASGHNWSVAEIVEPTCGEDGYVTMVCGTCGIYETSILPATGDHTFESFIVHDATCAHPGLLAYFCVECGYFEEYYTDINPDAHSFVSETVSEPTCITEGLVRHTCNFCGIVVDETVPALGHTWDFVNGVYVAPTCTTEGSWTFYCAKGCTDATYVVIISATEHVWVDVHVDGSNCCNPSVDKKVCAVCQTESEPVNTPIYYPTLKPGTNNLSFLNNILVVKIDKMTVGEFKANFSGSITVYNKNGKELGDEQYVGTNCTFVCDACGTEFVVAVIADINGDGKANSLDYMYVKRHVLKTVTLEGAMLAAADVNVDGHVNAIDYSQMKKHVMFRYSIYEKFPAWSTISSLIVSMPNPYNG